MTPFEGILALVAHLGNLFCSFPLTLADQLFICNTAPARALTVDGKVHIADVPRSEWFALVKNAHVGYITWEDYERNVAQLAVNSQAYAPPTLLSPHGRDRRFSKGSSSAGSAENA